MPELRNREAGIRQQIEALDVQLADREIYLTLADNVENFLAGFKNKAATANIALSVLDEHFAEAWRAGRGSTYQRTKRRRAGLANYRIVRYADDCVPRTRLEVAR